MRRPTLFATKWVFIIGLPILAAVALWRWIFG